jgi:hypothetical protein
MPVIRQSQGPQAVAAGVYGGFGQVDRATVRQVDRGTPVGRDWYPGCWTRRGETVTTDDTSEPGAS